MLEIRLVSNFEKDGSNFLLQNVKVTVEDRENKRRVEVVRFEGSTHTTATSFFTALKDSATAAFSSTLLE